MPMAMPPATGRKVAAVAVLLVSSVRKMTPAVTSSTMTRMGRAPRAPTESPIHWVRPELVNWPERARPPPKRSRTPQGSLVAVSQSMRRTPLLAVPPAGKAKSSRPTATAIPASVMGGDLDQIMGTKIQARAAAIKMMSTRSSPELMAPSLAYSLAMSFLPPGISLISGLKSTLVSRNQQTKSTITDRGTPTSIH